MYTIYRTLLLLVFLSTAAFAEPPLLVVDATEPKVPGDPLIIDATETEAVVWFDVIVSNQTTDDDSVERKKIETAVTALGGSVSWPAPRNDDPSLRFLYEGGKLLVLPSRAGDKYIVLVQAVENDERSKELLTFSIGGDPTPPPPPPPPPPPLSTVVETVKNAVKNTVTANTVASFTSLAAAYTVVAEDITSGKLTTIADIKADTKSRSQSAIGSDATALSQWTSILSTSLTPLLNQMSTDGRLTTTAQHAAVWLEIAEGIRQGLTAVPDPTVEGKKYVVIIYETADSSAAFGRMRTGLRSGPAADYLSSKGHWLTFSDDDAGSSEISDKLRSAYQSMTLPVLFLLDQQTESVLYKESLPANATADSVIATIKAHGG